MRVKDVNLKKVEQLLDETNGDLYIRSITFEKSEPVLNLYKPFDDSKKREELRNAVLSELMEWINDNDNNPNFLYNSERE